MKPPPRYEFDGGISAEGIADAQRWIEPRFSILFHWVVDFRVFSESHRSK